MSSTNRVTIGVDDNNSVIKWYDTTNNNPQVSMFNEQIGSNDGTSHFKIKKRINNNLAEIMRIDDDGKVTFYKNVSFDGGSNSINLTTTAIQDQQFEIGLFDSKYIASVSRTNVGTTYTYTFTVSKIKYIGENWTLTESNIWTTSIKHGLIVGDAIRFTTDGGGADAYSTNITYFVRTVPSTTTLTLSSTEAGSVIDSNDSSGNWNAAKITYKSSENGQTPDYVYFQNAKLTDGSDVPEFQAALEVIESTESIFKVVLTGVLDANAVDIDNNAYQIVVSKLSTLTNNTGIKILAQDNGSLNEAKLTFNTNNSNSFVIQNSVGTNNEALFLDTPVGGITNQFSTDKSYIIKNIDNDLKITLTDDSTTVANEKIILENTNGTDNSAISLTSKAGGITNTYNNFTDFTITDNDTTAVNSLIFKGDSIPENRTITFTNGRGTSNNAIDLTSNLGGITATCNNNKSIILQNQSTDTFIKLNANTDASSETIQLWNENGTDNDAISLTSSAGGIDIDASGLISIDSSGGQINIGNDNNNNNINIGTNGDRTITIGATGGTTSISLDGNVGVKGELESSSDKRLKKNIVELKGALDKINLLRGVSFKWKDTKINKGKNKKKKALGFIAQEVDKVIPDLTGIDLNGYMTVNYLGTTALLVEAIKEQQKIINELKTKVDKLSK